MNQQKVNSARDRIVDGSYRREDVIDYTVGLLLDALHSDAVSPTAPPFFAGRVPLAAMLERCEMASEEIEPFCEMTGPSW